LVLLSKHNNEQTVLYTCMHPTVHYYCIMGHVKNDLPPA